MGPLFSSSSSYNLDDLSFKDSTRFCANFIRDKGRGTLSVRTNDDGDRILTYSSSNILQRVARATKSTLRDATFHLEGVEKRDIRKLAAKVSINGSLEAHAFLPAADNILSQAEDTDQWSEPVNTREDLEALLFNFDKSLESDYCIVAKKDEQGVRFLVLPDDELSSEMRQESKQTLKNFFQEMFNVNTLNSSEDHFEQLVGRSFYISFMIPKEEVYLKDLHNNIREIYREPDANVEIQ